MSSEKDTVEKWPTDRRKIGLDALSDVENDSGVTAIKIHTGDELVGIATLSDNELLNLATARRGYGMAMLEQIAMYAIENKMHIEGLSTDGAIGFYCKAGWEVEGYPGDNAGVPIWWPLSQAERFLEDRDAMITEALEVWKEYSEEIER